MALYYTLGIIGFSCTLTVETMSLHICIMYYQGLALAVISDLTKLRDGDIGRDQA